MTNNKQIIQEMKLCTYFQNMQDNDLTKLLDISTISTFQKDTIIFYQGDESTYMHILLEGSVRIYKSKPSGGEVMLMKASSITSIAELACFEKIPYPATCSSTTEVKLLKIPFKVFEKEFLNNPEISYGMIKSLSLKLRSLSALIERELTLTSEQKVAKFIVDNQERLKEIKQVEIASELNITAETLSRMLRKLQKLDLLESTSPILLNDIEGLKEIYTLD